MPSAAEPGHFINVDLELAGPAKALAELVERLDATLFCLHTCVVRGRREAYYETCRSFRSYTVENVLRELLRVIERLPEGARRGWLAARVRDFNVGIQAGRQPDTSEYVISPETVRRVAALGGRLVFTVYAPWPRPRRGAA